MTLATHFSNASAASNSPPPDTREAEKALRGWGIEFTKRPDGFLEVQDLSISYKGLDKLPDLTCVVVKKDFSCTCNRLTCLAGAPQNVGETFYCAFNLLKTLAGAPPNVGKDFICNENPLTSLAYISKTAGTVSSDFGTFANSDAIPPELLKPSQEEIDKIVARAIAPLPYELRLKYPVIIKPRPPKADGRIS